MNPETSFCVILVCLVACSGTNSSRSQLDQSCGEDKSLRTLGRTDRDRDATELMRKYNKTIMKLSKLKMETRKPPLFPNSKPTNDQQKQLTSVTSSSGAGDPTSGNIINCTSQLGCRAGWKSPRQWTDCTHPIPQPECYNSIQWRISLCSRKPNHCKLSQWRYCLNNATSYGQWSEWKTIHSNCSTYCTKGYRRYILHCCKEGDLASVSLGGEKNLSNQTIYTSCSTEDYIAGQQSGTLRPTVDETPEIWTYTFYATLALIAVIFITVVVTGVYVWLKNRKRNDDQFGETEQSHSFVNRRVQNHRIHISRNLEQPSTTTTPRERTGTSHEYQIINVTETNQPDIPTTSCSSNENQLSVPVEITTQCLSKSDQLGKVSYPIVSERTRIISKYSSALDKDTHENYSFAAEDLEHHETNSSYTNMKSYTESPSKSKHHCGQTDAFRKELLEITSKKLMKNNTVSKSGQPNVKASINRKNKENLVRKNKIKCNTGKIAKTTVSGTNTKKPQGKINHHDSLSSKSSSNRKIKQINKNETSVLLNQVHTFANSESSYLMMGNATNENQANLKGNEYLMPMAPVTALPEITSTNVHTTSEICDYEEMQITEDRDIHNSASDVAEALVKDKTEAPREGVKSKK